MTGAYADVSALEESIIVQTLERVAILRPFVAMLLAEVLVAEDAQLAVLVAQVDPAGAEFASRVLAKQVLPA